MKNFARPKARIYGVFVAVASAAVGFTVIVAANATTAAYTDTAAATAPMMGNAVPFLLELSPTGNEGSFRANNPEGDPYPLSIRTFASHSLQSGAINAVEASIANVYIRIPGGAPNGDILPTLYKPSNCIGDCETVFNHLLVTPKWNGVAVSGISRVSVADFNSRTNRAFTTAVPGTSALLTLELTLDINTPHLPFGTTDSPLAIKLDGQSKIS